MLSTSATTTTGGKSGRMLSIVGDTYTTGAVDIDSNGLDNLGSPDQLVYISTSGSNFDDFTNVDSFSLGGWFKLAKPANYEAVGLSLTLQIFQR